MFRKLFFPVVAVTVLLLGVPAYAMLGFSTCHAAGTTVTNIDGLGTSRARMLSVETLPDSLHHVIDLEWMKEAYRLSGQRNPSGYMPLDDSGMVQDESGGAAEGGVGRCEQRLTSGLPKPITAPCGSLTQLASR
jgi:hypothetical protein